MSRLLAFVANPLTLGLGRAVAGNVAKFTTVVALLALGAVTSHVTETTARVAGLLATTEATAESTSVATAALGAAARNVSNTTALVALLATADTSTSTRDTAVAVSLGAFT